ASVKALIKRADQASAFFEATQLAGFGTAESLELFGRPPKGYSLTIEPLSAADAQAQYIHRFHLLSEAADFERSPAAFDTE
ncbi:MAG TPA: HD family hydrolase, partial [Caulobacteraceae bacterium]|nr:HD family hydrolase [Caulobacteraceae bacterium]